MSEISPFNPIGQDEWAAQEAARRQEEMAQQRAIARAARVWRTLDDRLKLLALLAVAALAPLLSGNSYLLRVAGITGLYVVLALGLNVVAGYAGLLDLGYVAFYGVGAYTYALLASAQFNLHLPFALILLLAILLTTLLGLALGSLSLRLRGDYLAIVTLGFGQIASLLFLNLDRPMNITGGPNGIVNLDAIRLLGHTLQSARAYYYLILCFVGFVFLVVFHLDRSRIGRAWRALCEDELAAQTMGVDVRRQKLLAFAVGAAIAGTAGTLFAAWQGAVFPPNFDLSILIIFYAMIVLGGVGSIWGAVSGAVILSILPELLRSPDTARLIFYGGLILGLLALSRRNHQRGLRLLVGVVLLGIVVKVAVGLLAAGATLQPVLQASTARSFIGPFVGILNQWMVFPRAPHAIGNFAFVVALALLLGAARWPKGRDVLLVPGLYTLAFAWETRLVQEPSITRMIIFGVLLVLMMNYRPQGLLGEKRVQR